MMKFTFCLCVILCAGAMTSVFANKNKNRATAASQRASKDGQIKKERQRLNQYSPHQGANKPKKANEKNENSKAKE